MKYIKYRIILLSAALLLGCNALFAQQENDKWHFGQNQWDFNGGSFNATEFANYNKYATASISDNNTGQLLFYSNGLSIRDRNGNLMNNGNQLVGTNPAFYDSAFTCGGNMTSQGVVILPKPGSPNQYYVFTTVNTNFPDCAYAGNTYYNLGVRYAIVDMSSGLGTVTSKNNIIQSESSAAMTGALTNDGSSYWLTVTNSGSFNAYKIDASGISNKPIVSQINSNGGGAIKISPNGDKLLHGYSLYNFNNTTGAVSNPIDIIANAAPFEFYEDQSIRMSSKEFSSNGNIIYFVSSQQSGTTGQALLVSGLSMYNISTGELFGADSSTAGYFFDLYHYGSFAANLQRAANGKIYLIFNLQTEEGPPFFEQIVEFGENDFLPPHTHHAYDWGVINNPDMWDTGTNPILFISPPLGIKNGYVFPQLIPEGPTCLNDITITADVLSGQNDTQQAANTITATNTIFSGGSAEYDAGLYVYLEPGFHAESGSEFRAYIEGCTVPSPAPIGGRTATQISSNREDLNLADTNVVTLYPNPTTGRFQIVSQDDMVGWEITNGQGKDKKGGVLDNSKQFDIDISNSNSGVYFLRIMFENGNVQIKTIIRN